MDGWVGSRHTHTESHIENKLDKCVNVFVYV